MKISFCGPCEQVSNHFLSICRVLSPCKEVGDIFPDAEASENGIAERTFSRSRSILTSRHLIAFRRLDLRINCTSPTMKAGLPAEDGHVTRMTDMDSAPWNRIDRPRLVFVGGRTVIIPLSPPPVYSRDRLVSFFEQANPNDLTCVFHPP